MFFSYSYAMFLQIFNLYSPLGIMSYVMIQKSPRCFGGDYGRRLYILTFYELAKESQSAYNFQLK